MSRCWLGTLLVIVAAAPFSVAVVTLLQVGNAQIQASALMVGFLVFVIVVVMGLLQKHTPDNEANTTEEGLSRWVADSESPPAYDVVIKTPPPYISYPGHGSIAHPASAAAMYYCYCGSNATTTSASFHKPCNSQLHVPYIIHLNQDSCHSKVNLTSSGSDQFLPSYSEAVKVHRINSSDHITHL
ncbi:unnamed protein product [Meganyctiphanes norvegica]|uniref:Uncharacterized protein n=1 Tax=Meganyctiphanes norvegica TaxID=48144 RepID=A0AAV2QKT4_MEGNR